MGCMGSLRRVLGVWGWRLSIRSSLEGGVLECSVWRFNDRSVCYFLCFVLRSYVLVISSHTEQ